MRKAVYNSAIPKALSNSVNGGLGQGWTAEAAAAQFTARPTPRLVGALRIGLFVLALSVRVSAADWSGPEQQLARKVVAVTGPGAVALTIENRSSLGRRDSEIIQNGLRSALEALGIRFVGAEEAAATVALSLSENAGAYVWVAEIRQGAGEVSVVMVSTPRPEGSSAAHDSVPLSLRRTPLWTQADPVLDVAVLEEGATPTHIAVLDSDKVSLYRLQGGRWQQELTLGITHARPWPRDLRGRLVSGRGHLLDAYLPGVTCNVTTETPMRLNCHESDDPWPLVSTALNGNSSSVLPGQTSVTSAGVPEMRAFFAPTRNFFTGALTPGVGRFTSVPKFYSAAPLPREKYTLWLFAATDGQMHLIDGLNDRAARFEWGSTLTSVKTACGVGWQVLATAVGGGGSDSVRAYEFPDRDPVAVSAAVDFPGVITALWTEAKGDTAIVVAKNRDTGSYEAFRLAVACGQ